MPSNLDGAVDVMVVGAGPAGLATAIESRLRGLTVTVLDRRLPPLDKPCGEGLMPDGLERLAAMGIHLGDGCFSPFHGISYIDGEYLAEGEFPGVQGAGIRRLKLHAAMLTRAEELGIPVHWQIEVEALSSARAEAQIRDLRAADGASSETASPRETVSTETVSTETLKARFVVVADGLRSPLRRALGLQGKSSKRQRFGARQHYEIEPWTQSVEVHWGDQAEAYVTPVASREVGVAILWGGRKAGFSELLAGFPTLVDRLKGAGVLSKVKGAGPLRQPVKSVVQGKIALVGDAAGYVDAITGEGLSIAFHQAEALADSMADDDLSAYPGRCRAILRQPSLMTELLLFLEERPRLRRRVVRALARDARMFDQFLAVHCRAHPASSLVRWIPRMLWQLARA